MTADSLTVMDAGKKVEAKGHVELRREGTILRADEVRMDRETQDVEAKGHVSLEDPRGTLKADAIRMNLEQETAEVENGDLFFSERQLSVTGRRFQKLPGQAYHVDDAFFTTCLCESGAPSWKIGASQVDLTPEGSGVVRGGTFYIKDIPVFYLPYGFFPLRTERQTGFLFPKLGSSSKDGFRFQQPFFWALSKSSDATVAIDLQTRARVGLTSELRNVWSRQTHGQVNLSYFNESLRDRNNIRIGDPTIADPEIPKDRWNIFATHRQASPSGWTTYSDVSAFSDDLFTRELVDRLDLLPRVTESSLRSSRYSRSRFGLFRSWDSAHLKGEWDFYQDFIQEDERTLHRTPQLSVWGRRPLGETPLELRWRGDAVNYIRRDGGDGLRMDLRPEVMFPFRLPAHLFGSWSVAPRGTFYHLYQTENSSKHNVSRELIELRGNLGTSLGRVFHWGGAELEKIRHIVEPELSYLFIPGVRQRDIPIMDGVDRIGRRNVLTFGLNHRFWGKYTGQTPVPPEEKDVELLDSVVSRDVEDLAQARVALSYDIDRERKGGDSLSDLDMNLQFHPLPSWTVGFDAGLNPGPWHLTQAAATLGLSDPRPIVRRVLDPDFMQPNSLNLSYRFMRKGPNAFLSEDANIDLSVSADCSRHPLDPRCPGTAFNKNVLGELGGRILYRLTDHLLFFLNSSYNVRDSRSANNRAAIKILSQCECWTVTLSLRRNINPSKTSFNFDFNLLGLGSQRSALR